jgi:N-formylglutamate amidohydrolase
MAHYADPEFDPPFIIHEPECHSIPFVVNVPHAGDVYPPSLLGASHVDALTLRRAEDAFVDDLFGNVVSLGAPLMAARFPRILIDLNREPYELDPRLFAGKLPPFANTHSMRVKAGLGTIPRLVADGQDIYKKRLSLEEGLRRIETLYKPYHRALNHLVNITAKSYGHAVLIDGHSMPSQGDMNTRADIVLGDRFGASCCDHVVHAFEHAFRAQGLRCIRNKPYAGGYITEHYGEPGNGRHALQIEINRGLYMDERRFERLSHFGAVKAMLTEVLKTCIGEIMNSFAHTPLLIETPLAAE